MIKIRKNQKVNSFYKFCYLLLFFVVKTYRNYMYKRSGVDAFLEENWVDGLLLQITKQLKCPWAMGNNLILYNLHFILEYLKYLQKTLIPKKL